MSKHTPGPWQVKAHTATSPEHITPGCDFTICGQDGASIAFEGEWNPNAAADARLIAAAPELLDALRPFASVDLRTQGVHHRFAEDVLRARAALAKAGGELFNTTAETRQTAQKDTRRQTKPPRRLASFRAQSWAFVLGLPAR